MRKLAAMGITKTAIAIRFGISCTSVCNYLQKANT